MVCDRPHCHEADNLHLQTHNGIIPAHVPFDADAWGNRRADTDHTGFTIANEGRISAAGDDIPIVDQLADLTIEPIDAWQSAYRIRHANGDIAEEATAFSRALIANLQTGVINIVGSLTSPIADIDTLRTHIISPIATASGKITVNLNTTQTFGIQNAETNQTVTTFDSVGNATLSGTLTAETLEVTGDATVSGQLYTDRIVTRFGDLDTRFQSLEDSVSSISTQSGTNPVSPSPKPSPTADYGGTVSISNGDVVINTVLFVLGDTLLSSTSVPAHCWLMASYGLPKMS